MLLCSFVGLRLDGTLKISAVVRNTRSSAGDAVVQLKGFQRIALQPGEERTVRFEVPVESLGCFTAWIGPDSTRGLEARFVAKG